MKFYQSAAEIFVPGRKLVAEALERITHLGIGAHQDDLEFMAFHGILNCFASETTGSAASFARMVRAARAPGRD